MDGARDHSQSMNRRNSRGRPRSLSTNPSRGRSRSVKQKPSNINNVQTQVQECASSKNVVSNKTSNIVVELVKQDSVKECVNSSSNNDTSGIRQTLKNVRFALINIQGLIKKRQNKLQAKELISVFSDDDIVCLTETWGDSSQIFDVDGFSFFELHRTDVKPTSTSDSGGVIIYIGNIFMFDDTLFLKCSDTHIWLKLRHESFDFENDLYLCLCYVVPSNSSRQGVTDTNVFDEIVLNITHIKYVNRKRM